MDGCVDVWARFEDPGVNRRLARRRADTAELVQLVVEVNEPILLAAFGTAKHLYCDALILGQAHAHMTPYVAHFVFENLGADAKFFFGEFNGGALLSVGPFCFLHGVSGCLPRFGPAGQPAFSLHIRGGAQERVPHEATLRMEAKLAGFSFLAENVK